jgi:hypothetical protein
MSKYIFLLIILLALFIPNAYSQADGFFPEVDTVFIGGECSPPGIKCLRLVSSTIQDSIVIGSVPEWQSRMWYFDSSGTRYDIDNIYAISIDSLDHYEYEVLYHHNYSPESIPIPVPFDTLFICDSTNHAQTLILQLLVKDQDITVDSLSQLFFAEFGTGITSDKSPEIEFQRIEIKQRKYDHDNSMLSINYTLTEPGLTDLSIYSMKGRLIANLVNSIQSAGSHSYIWYTDNITSGFYFVKFTNNTYTTFKKLCLIK